MGISSFNRNQVAWIWNASVRNLQEMVDQTVFGALQAGEQVGFKHIGVLLIFDTEMVEDAELEELQTVLMEMKTRVDARNERSRQTTTSWWRSASTTKQRGTGTLTPESHPRTRSSAHSTSFWANASRWISTITSWRQKNIRGEAVWKVNQNKFRGQEISESTLLEWINRLCKFLEDDNGMRCRETDLSFPYKKDGKGNIKYLPNFKVAAHIPRNTMNVVTEGVDPEALYWVRTRLLRVGLEEDQVPALPELDLTAYALRPVRKGQTAGMFPEAEEEKAVRRLKRKEDEKTIYRELALSGQALLSRVLDLGTQDIEAGVGRETEPV